MHCIFHTTALYIDLIQPVCYFYLKITLYCSDRARGRVRAVLGREQQLHAGPLQGQDSETIREGNYFSFSFIPCLSLSLYFLLFNLYLFLFLLPLPVYLSHHFSFSFSLSSAHCVSLSVRFLDASSNYMLDTETI